MENHEFELESYSQYTGTNEVGEENESEAVDDGEKGPERDSIGVIVRVYGRIVVTPLLQVLLVHYHPDRAFHGVRAQIKIDVNVGNQSIFSDQCLPISDLGHDIKVV